MSFRSKYKRHCNYLETLLFNAKYLLFRAKFFPPIEQFGNLAVLNSPKIKFYTCNKTP